MTPRSILIVGEGGRERSLAARFAAEGVRATVLPWAASSGRSAHEAVIDAAARNEADLVVIGPEAPLVDGLADRLAERSISVFGPSAAAARLEGSKAFARAMAREAGVAVAEGESFEDLEAAVAYARSIAGGGAVVKANGLAGGKGVVMCDTADEAEAALRESRGRFGPAAARMVVERRVVGREASVIAICDGETAVPLPPARDHKRVGDGETGLNTGGMGAYSPLEDLSDSDAELIVERFHRPVLRLLVRHGVPFRGALYAGLMLTAEGPILLEFNVRFGDPETQAIMPRLDLPLARLLHAAAGGRLDTEMKLLPLTEPTSAAGVVSVAVVIAAEGYPGTPRRGDPVEVARDGWPSGAVLHWGAVRAAGDGDSSRMITDGGRVATVVGTGETLDAAAAVAYEGCARVRFRGAFYRRDIGRGALEALIAGAVA